MELVVKLFLFLIDEDMIKKIQIWIRVSEATEVLLSSHKWVASSTFKQFQNLEKKNQEKNIDHGLRFKFVSPIWYCIISMKNDIYVAEK